ncbi:MAG: class I SAM-dependent RNA methyltransferase [Lentisphaeria bacterium]
MLELGQLIKVTISDIAFGGDGVARLDEGPVIFVPFSALGDVLNVEISEQKKSYFRAVIREILVPGSQRIEPYCLHFGRCGGCAYQHLDYPAEFAAKQKQLLDLLQRIGGFSTPLSLEYSFPAPEIYGYRNKLRLEPSEPERDESGVHMAYGYCLKDRKNFFTVKECPLAQPILNQTLNKAIRSPWGRQNAKKPVPGAMTLRASSDGLCHYYFGRAPVNVTWLKEKIHGQEVSVPLGSFWQVNSAVADELLKKVSEWAEPLPVENLVDAYSGVGTFSLAITRPFRERILIESDGQAGDAASLNLSARSYGCQIIKDTTEHALPKVLKSMKAAQTLVVLDPPRTGCQEKVLQSLLKGKPAHVFYISCNPATLARDLKKLCGEGKYQVKRLALFDMFPRTAHFETVVELSRQP